MIRTQISLTPEQMAGLKRAAQRRGMSMAAVIREAVEREIATDPDERARLWERAVEIVGRGRDREARGDVARRHDVYLEEFFSQE